MLGLVIAIAVIIVLFDPTRDHWGHGTYEVDQHEEEK